MYNMAVYLGPTNWRVWTSHLIRRPGYANQYDQHETTMVLRCRICRADDFSAFALTTSKYTVKMARDELKGL